MMSHKYIPPIHIHPILLVFIVISFLTGTFMELFIILAIVLVHELGHYAMAASFRWRIKNIMLWVFGGVMVTDEHGNRPIYEEMLVTIAGPLQHILIYGGCILMSMGNFFPSSVLELLLYYNTLILVFNLLPIWPLDGGKFLFLVLSSLMPYRRAYHSVIITSLVLCFIALLLLLFVFPFTLSSFLLMAFLLKENRLEWKDRYYVFIRFLLNRYHGDKSFKGIRQIVVPYQYPLMEVFSKFYRNKKHNIFIEFPGNEQKRIEEAACLRCYFHDKQYSQSIGELARFM